MYVLDMPVIWRICMEKPVMEKCVDGVVKFVGPYRLWLWNGLWYIVNANFLVLDMRLDE